MAAQITAFRLKLQGETYLVEEGGMITVFQDNNPVCSVRLDSIQDAIRFERVAKDVLAPYRWLQIRPSFGTAKIFSVDDFIENLAKLVF